MTMKYSDLRPGDAYISTDFALMVISIVRNGISVLIKYIVLFDADDDMRGIRNAKHWVGDPLPSHVVIWRTS